MLYRASACASMYRAILQGIPVRHVVVLCPNEFPHTLKLLSAPARAIIGY